MSTFYKLRIEKIIRETPEAITICFAIPEDLKDAFTFIPGQYVNLQLVLDGETLRRSYSICNGPNENTLNVTVKAIKRGKFSVFANTLLKEGALIEVSKPEGRFLLNPNLSNKKNYLAIAAGSGITPIMSMIKHVLTIEKESNFVLLYGNKSADKTIFFNTLENLQNKYPNQFFLNYCFSEKPLDSHYFGRIDLSKINNLIKQKHGNLKFDDSFLCGPEELIQLSKETLIANDFADDQIKFELFTSSVSEKNVSSSAGICLAKVIVDDETFEVEIEQNQTILDAVLKAGIDAPYSCQGGVCSSCIAKASDGNAQMKKNTVLTDSEVQSGLILTCQALCQSESLTVDYDNV
jgi:ring-1,2-phenylacetyl-CoA epoxidase subunit PaaE